MADAQKVYVHQPFYTKELLTAYRFVVIPC